MMPGSPITRSNHLEVKPLIPKHSLRQDGGYFQRPIMDILGILFKALGLSALACVL